jgi:chromate transporter
MSTSVHATAPRWRSDPGVPAARALRAPALYFLRLGSSGFGRPTALVGYMRRDLLEQRGWFTEQDRQGLALTQKRPGRLAAQLAARFGCPQAGALGAAAVAVRFVLPPCLLAAAVAVPYTQYQRLAGVHEIFLEVGPMVLAITAFAACKLARASSKTDQLLWAIAAGLCEVTAIAKTEILWLFLSAAAFGLLHYGGEVPRWRPSPSASFSPVGIAAAVSGFARTGSGWVAGTMGLFFAHASAFMFGSAAGYVGVGILALG